VDDFSKSFTKLRMDYLQTYRVLVNLESFSETAKQLDRTQSAISQQIKELEEALGTELIVRSSKKFKLTNEGQFVYEKVCSILDDINSMIEQLALIKGNPRIQFSIAASSVPGEFLMPLYCNEFQKQNPNIEIHISISNSESAIKDLFGGKVQLSVIGGIFSANAQQLEMIKIGSDIIHILGRKKHPIINQLNNLAKNQTVNSTDQKKALDLLVAYPWIFREQGSATRNWFLTMFPAPERIKIALEFHNNLAIINTIENCDALTALSSYMVPQLVTGKNVEIINHPSIPHIQRDFYAIKLKDHTLSNAEQKFWDFLASKVKNI
jgi:DNA-binding transcriptional LysR family regulator